MDNEQFQAAWNLYRHCEPVLKNGNAKNFQAAWKAFSVAFWEQVCFHSKEIAYALHSQDSQW